MTKRLFRNDPDNGGSGITIFEVADDYVLQSAETFDEPANDLQVPLTILGDGTWQGASVATVKANEAKYLADNPDAVPQPTTEQLALTALAQQNADLSQENADLKQHVESIEQAMTALAIGGTS
jgi:hypothetical protein